MNEIGQRMRQLREASQISQVEIAKLSGSNQATIAKMETGKTAPSVKLLVWWADYFDVSLDYLCCRTSTPQGKLYEHKPKVIEAVAQDSTELRRFVDMCFDPASPVSEKLRDVLTQMLQEGTK